MLRSSKRKLITPQTRKNIGLTKAGAQDVCSPGQCVVALQVAVGVVDRFQSIEVHKHEQGRALAQDQTQVLFGERQKATTIVQAGQLIEQGKAMQRLLKAMALNGIT